MDSGSPGGETGPGEGPSAGPASAPGGAAWSDHYSLKTKAAVPERFGDRRVTYAIFMRRPVVSAPRLASTGCALMAAERNTDSDRPHL